MQKSKEYKAELIREATRLIKELETEEGEFEILSEDRALLNTLMKTKEEPQSND